MAGINKVILVGNLGKDPEIRVMESGRKQASFPLATSETYRDKDGQRQEQTEWHNVVFWGSNDRPGLAGVVEQYLKKGSQVYIEGKIRTRSYQDKDNQTKYITEILGRELTMLGGRPDGGSSNGYNNGGNNYQNQNNQQSQPAPTSFDSSGGADDDDLPF
jgi:single-strand DNA-binding protein